MFVMGRETADCVFSILLYMRYLLDVARVAACINAEWVGSGFVFFSVPVYFGEIAITWAVSFHFSLKYLYIQSTYVRLHYKPLRVVVGLCYFRGFFYLKNLPKPYVCGKRHFWKW